MTLGGLTPFQTVGPYLSLGLRAGMVPAVAESGLVTIRGRLLDGAGHGIPDGVLEFWHPHLCEVRRGLTGGDGSFAVTVARPRALDGPDGRQQAPHFAVRVLGRGILTQYYTRLYFPDEPRTATDLVLQLVPDARRGTLVALALAPDEYRFDVIVQGAGETVFFDV
jgi:protocatechuate 3,4-dioxygenase alpha subunit